MCDIGATKALLPSRGCPNLNLAMSGTHGAPIPAVLQRYPMCILRRLPGVPVCATHDVGRVVLCAGSLPPNLAPRVRPAASPTSPSPPFTTNLLSSPTPCSSASCEAPSAVAFARPLRRLHHLHHALVLPRCPVPHDRPLLLALDQVAKPLVGHKLTEHPALQLRLTLAAACLSYHEKHAAALSRRGGRGWGG